MSLFKGKTVEMTPDKEGFQMKAGQDLANWFSKNLSQYTPGKDYTGNFTASMTQPEKMSQDFLLQYLNSEGTGDLFGLAKDEVSKTLTGGYDPYTSEYYKPFKEAALNEQADAIDRLRRSQGARGSYFHEGVMRDEADVTNTTTNYLDQLLATISQNERANRMNVIPTALQMDQYETNIPLAKTQAAQAYGSLPRLIEQSDLESQYQNFVRQQNEKATIPGVGQGVFSTPINYGVKSYETPSTFERIMQTAGPLIGEAAAAFATGGASAPFSAAKRVTSGNKGSSGLINNASNVDWLSSMF